MKIIHFSDPHGGGPAEDWLAYFDKRWVGVFNYTFRRRFRHDLSSLARAVSYILDTRPNVAVCTGDLTSAGQPGEFQKVLDILKPLRDSNIPLIYTPGNHDCYVTRPKCVAAVKNAVNYLSRGQWRFDDMPLTLDIAGVKFIVVNTSAPSNLLCSWGFLTEKSRDFIINACKQSPEMPHIMVTHYPLLEKHPILRMRHRLFGQQPIVELLNDGSLDLALCGHVHKFELKTDANGRGECCSGSVTRNGSMVEIDCDTRKRTFTYKTIKL